MPARILSPIVITFVVAVTAVSVAADNLDYKAEATVILTGPGRLDAFDATSGAWSATGGARLELRLPPGGGRLVRMQK